MSQPRSKFVWNFLLLFCAVLPASSQPHDSLASAPGGLPTCDARSLDPDSYALTTRAQADIVNEDRSEWWDRFLVGKHAADLRDLNFSATSAAEHALRLDPRNLLAHALLARQYVVIGEDARLADASWQTTLDHGGSVVWTATLYDVDVKSYFVMAFDREALRVYRYGELAGPFEKTMGMPKFVGADRERFWRALAGCIDPEARPEAVISWTDVREIKGGNWVLWFKLARRATIGSDNGKRKTLDEIKVNLHGATGTIEVHTTEDTRDPRNVSVRPIGMGPYDYNQRVRYTIAKHVDPAGRIKLPKASRSAGW
jgi:hypothetical protein